MSQHGHHGQSIGPYTPSGQVRLTNVAYVRLQSHGHRFEIACYRNKVLSWRNKIETDIGEVLQKDTVYTNVTRGLLASTEHLMEAFGTTNQLDCCKKILEKGEMQISEQEREALVEATFRDVVAIVADKSVNPETNRSYTTTMIQNAMKQAHINVVTSRNVKAQALEVIRKLKEVMPIARASMGLRVVSPISEEEVVRGKLNEDLGLLILKESRSAEMVYYDVRIDPEMFRKIEEMVQTQTKGQGRVEVTQFRDSAPPSLNPNAAVNSAVIQQSLESGILKDSKNKTASGVGGGSSKKSISFKDGDAGTDNSKAGEGDSYAQDDSESDDAEDNVFNVKKKSGGGSSKQAEESESKGGSKKSKSKKRYEKEEMKEKEKRLNLIRERVRDDQARSTTAQAASEQNLDSDGNDIKDISGNSNSNSNNSNNSDNIGSTTNNNVAASAGAIISERPSPSVPAIGGSSAPPAAGGQKCNTCGGMFPDAAAYRNHFRSEWHRHNLKRKMKNLPVISSEEDFLKLPIEELEI